MNMIKSNRKIFFISKSMALVIWGVSIADLIVNYILWSSKKQEMLYGIIESIDPSLLAKNIELSSMSVISLIILTYMPIFISSLGLFFVGYFFFKTSQGEVWTSKNIKILFIGGVLAILSPMARGLLDTFESLAISINLPKGERVFVFYLGFSLSAMRDLIYGVVLLSLSLIMTEAKKVSDENKEYV
ncbi:hypothetical protein HZI31_22410 [Serratia fonticola]|nr:hypothetical protein [Serratia fonticola]NYA46047.1 hypothetical protein [Serratia fonticola]